jgi:tetrahydromethanopterin S-methyltransferase subunit F
VLKGGTGQAVHAVRQLAAGEAIKPARPLSAGAIIGIVLGVLFLLILIVVPMLNYFT